MSSAELDQRVVTVKALWHIFLSIGTSLKVKSIDLQKEKNRELHHTADFEQDELIIRRGQVFSLTITFDRNPNDEEDLIALLITTGRRQLQMRHFLQLIFSYFSPKMYIVGAYV